MRSRIDIKTRLAAHIAALILLGIILVYAEPTPPRIGAPADPAAGKPYRPPETPVVTAEIPKPPEAPAAP
ncbi:MAG: hypothetical protein LBU23_12850, partial [Planctomycetota bacterium]|nr:hypothetical protein [Planctomycetota bacterium]